MTMIDDLTEVTKMLEDVKPECEHHPGVPATHYGKHVHCDLVRLLCTKCVLASQSRLQSRNWAIVCECGERYTASQIPARIRDFPIERI